ncbi:ABC transporter permease [Lichenicoccus sp.]|uniref:ABC transporter permease n=1 Tax=Lichenicoccus sp. TaxID=2781899 RepID=UPI003D0BAE36
MADGAIATDTPSAAGRPRFDPVTAFRRYGTLVIFVLIIAGATWQSPDFLTVGNIMNVLRQVSGTGIMSVGMLFVILTGGIDLSVGSVAALGSVTAALMLQQHGSFVSLGAAILAGAACGVVSGFTVAYLRLPPFVMTLAVMTIARGLALIFSDGQPIMIGDNGAMLNNVINGYIAGIPNPVLLMAAVFLAAGVTLGLTRFGRLVQATGSNIEAVRLSGIAVPRYILAVYVISGALAAAAGIIITGRSGVGSATVGTGAELTVIAAVVIGGASLMGGRGGALNTLLGVLVLGVIGNIMNLAGVPGYSQDVFMGVIIMVAVLLQQGSQWLRR